MTMTPEQRERLPAYARKELDRLEKDLREARDRNVELVGGVTGRIQSRVRLPYVVNHETPVFLPDSTMVDFFLDEPDDLNNECHMSVRISGNSWIDKPVLDINCTHPLFVLPGASNLIHLLPAKRH